MNHMKHTPLFIAVINSHLAMVQMLTEHGCNVLQKNGCELNALEMAESMGLSEIHDFLEPITEEASIWEQRNCLAKLF